MIYATKPIRTILIYTLGSLVWFCVAVSAVVASSTARRSGNLAAYNAAVYKAWSSGLLCAACVLLVSGLFVKYAAIDVVSFLFFVSAGILLIVSRNRSRAIGLNIPKAAEGKGVNKVTTPAQDASTVWPPAPRLPDDEEQK